MSVSFPRIYTRPDFDRLMAACRGIDGSELVRAFFCVQHDTGKRTWDCTQTPEFRLAFIAMLDEARDNWSGARFIETLREVRDGSEGGGA